MKLVFLGSSATIIYYMRFHRVVRTTYDRELDTFRAWVLIVPCLLLALVMNQGFTPIEVRGHLSCGVCTLISKGYFGDTVHDPRAVTADPVGILPLLGGRSHPAAAGVVAKDAEY